MLFVTIVISLLVCGGLSEEDSGGICKAGGGNCQEKQNPCDGPYLSGFCKGNLREECCFEPDIMKVQTTGASAITANIDHLKYRGVEASQTIAHTDLNNILLLKEKILRVSNRTGIDAAIIAAIISRESRGNRKLLDVDGYARTTTHAFGGMQIKKRETKDGPFSEDHFYRATCLFIQKIEAIMAQHSDWSKEYILKGAIAAYNMGEWNVWTKEKMDVGSNNGDYSNDVAARAQWYKSSNIFFDKN